MIMHTGEPKNPQLIESEERTHLSEVRTDLSIKRTSLSEERRDLALQRTHLANNRTFQAWVRTGLALVSFGFGIAQFILSFSDEEALEEFNLLKSGSGQSLLIGLIMIGVGVLLTVLAYINYTALKREIGKFDHVSYPWLSFIISLTITLGGVVFIINIIRQVMN